MYPIQDTSRMGTARVKREEEADIRIIVKEESPKQGLTSAEDVTIERPEGRKSHYHRQTNLWLLRASLQYKNTPLYLTRVYRTDIAR